MKKVGKRKGKFFIIIVCCLNLQGLGVFFFFLLGDLFVRGILILQKGIWDITQMVLLLDV